MLLFDMIFLEFEDGSFVRVFFLISGVFEVLTSLFILELLLPNSVSSSFFITLLSMSRFFFLSFSRSSLSFLRFFYLSLSKALCSLSKFRLDISSKDSCPLLQFFTMLSSLIKLLMFKSIFLSLFLFKQLPLLKLKLFSP